MTNFDKLQTISKYHYADDFLCEKGKISGTLKPHLDKSWGDGERSFRFFNHKEIWSISVRLSDRSEVTQHKINLIKNCRQWGLNLQPPDH